MSMRRNETTRFSLVEGRETKTERERERERERKGEGQSTLSHKKRKKEMPQLELHNVPKRAGPPTGVVTGQMKLHGFTSVLIQTTAAKLRKKSKQSRCIYVSFYQI